ncbi:MAG: tail fiber domain-containing protein [Bacteroidales bacterium]|nr:tail fiber domain-containing protein [Bacteroidales bacterium]
MNNGYTGVGTTIPKTKFQIGAIWTFYDGPFDKIIGRNTYYNGTNNVRINSGIASRMYFSGEGDIVFQTIGNGTVNSIISDWKTVSMKNNGNVGIATMNPKEILQIGDIWTFHNGNTKYMGRNTSWDYTTNTTNRRIAAGYASLIGFSTEGSIQIETFGDGAANSALSRTGYMVLTANGNVGIGRDPSSMYKLDVNGTIRVGSTVYSSDERLKINIKNVSLETEKLYKLQGKSYTKTTIPTREIETKDTTQFFEYGYLAQELQQIFPELVSQDSEGYYAINYVALIPVIVEALKEQQKTIITLQQKLENKELSATLKSSEVSATQEMYLSESGNTEMLKLYQNAPNPFNERTTVKCYVPEHFQKVQLCVYTMQGVQVQCISITERGNVSIEIKASTLSSGIYSYVLLADGIASETKQMILTKQGG